MDSLTWSPSGWPCFKLVLGIYIYIYMYIFESTNTISITCSWGRNNLELYVLTTRLGVGLAL